MSMPGRNDPCPCGSGKKYKQCCLKGEAEVVKTAVERPNAGEVPRLFDMAVASFQAGQLPAAEQLLAQILRVAPKHVDALHLAGVVAYQRGRPAEAVSLMNKSVKLQPGNADCFSNLGLAQQALGKLAEAAASFRQALALQPRHANAHFNLGNVLFHQGQLARAEESYRKALALVPQHVEALNGLGNVCQREGRLDEAGEAYRQAISLNPHFAMAEANLANVFRLQGDLAQAIAAFDRAIAINPNYASAYSQRGNVLELQDRLPEAESSLRQAIALDPQSAPAYTNLGNILLRLGRLAEAAEAHRQAMACNPRFASSFCNLGNVLLEQGLIPEALESYRKALALAPEDASSYSNLLMAMQYDATISPASITAEHLAYAKRFELPLRKQLRPHSNLREPERRLRVGFVSGDLREHPVGYFLEGVLGALAGRSLDIVLYPTSSVMDALSERLQAVASAWHCLAGLSDAQAAERVRADAIDILVDLSGHTAGNRLPLFAYKPAPIQVAWLGYWATTGLRAMDYILVDPHSVPQQEREQFVEQPWYLPETRLCFTPPALEIAVSELPALSGAPFTFACFNNLSKVGEGVLRLWAAVLAAVPQARLLVKTKQLNDETEQRALLARFAAHGVAPERLLLEGASPRREYLESYQRVDVVLDPFPFTGATTSVEGLWMGVPFITRRGDRLVAHQGESLLQNMGLQSWIAGDDDDYVAIARRWAEDLSGLAGLRAQLRQRLLASPLCDAPRFAQHFEQAMREMWQRYCDA